MSERDDETVQFTLTLSKRAISRLRWYAEDRMDMLARIAEGDRYRDSVRERARSESAIYAAILEQLLGAQQ